MFGEYSSRSSRRHLHLPPSEGALPRIGFVTSLFRRLSSYLPGAPVNNYTTILFCEVKSYISLKPSGVTLFRWQPLDLAVYWTIDVGRLRRYFLLPAEAEQLRMRDQYPTELSPLDKSSATVFKHYMPL